MNEPLTVQEAPAGYQVMLDSLPVRAGYKQTEVGVIPEDWQLSTLGEICLTSSGTTPSRSMPERYYRNGSIPWVKTLDLNDSEIINTDELVTICAVEETSLRPYPIGTVLVAMYGGYNQIGRTGLLKIPAAVNQAITAIQPQKNVLLPEYLLATLNFKVEYWKSVASSSRKDPNITSQNVREFPIGYPHLPEQRAIATALSNVDALLAAQDKLIAKKRDIKQAAMQQLLTGKQRLPGFSGEWEVKRLGDVCGRVTTGKLDANAMVESGEYPFFTCAREHYFIDEYAFDADALLVSGNGANVGYVHHYTGKFNAYQRTYVLTDFNAEILYLRLFMDRNLQGRLRTEVNAGNTPYITMDTLTEMRVALPRTREEQTAIATILSDMDADLTALEQQRDKTRALKQGMMQELLTGRIRLI